MASFYTYNTTPQISSTSSHRGVAMVLALVSAVVLSPLYVTRSKHDHYHERKLGSYSGYSPFVLPLVLGGLIVAIKTTSSSSMATQRRGGGGGRVSMIPTPEPSWVLRIGSSSWGLAGVLVLLLLVLSWQDSVQDFFWR